MRTRRRLKADTGYHLTLERDVELTERDLGEYRITGRRLDGWLIVTTVEIIGNTNTFEVSPCEGCHRLRVRDHDAEANRLERTA